MAQYVFDPNTLAWGSAADAVIVNVPDEITDADDIEEYLHNSSEDQQVSVQLMMDHQADLFKS